MLQQLKQREKPVQRVVLTHLAIRESSMKEPLKKPVGFLKKTEGFFLKLAIFSEKAAGFF
ncbi:MAG: hypothetical protein RR559_05910 [Bacteroides sp.]